MRTLATNHHQATVNENIKYEEEVIKVGILYAQFTNSNSNSPIVITFILWISGG